MSAIPDDIWRAAQDVAASVFVAGTMHHQILAGNIARAIIKERQRCADITKRMLRYADTTSASDEAIYAAILAAEGDSLP